MDEASELAQQHKLEYVSCSGKGSAPKYQYKAEQERALIAAFQEDAFCSAQRARHLQLQLGLKLEVVRVSGVLSQQ